MTAADTIYSVRTDNGLGGLVVGREAADELVTVLGSRPDVLTVTATPLGTVDALAEAIIDWEFDSVESVDRTLAETLAFLGHGEQL